MVMKWAYVPLTHPPLPERGWPQAGGEGELPFNSLLTLVNTRMRNFYETSICNIWDGRIARRGVGL